MEVNEYEKACEYFRRALEIYPDVSVCKEDYRQFRIMASYYYRLVAAVCDKTQEQGQLLSIIRQLWIYG